MLIICANEFWFVFAIPALLVNVDKSNSTVAGLLFTIEVILKNLNPLSSELKPSPGVKLEWVYCCIPSTNISSPTENGAVLKPNIGVTKVQVTIPVDGLNSTVFIVAPLLLLSANISWVTDFKPLDGTIIDASTTALPFIVASTDPDVSCNPVSGFTITKSGSVV